MDKPKMKTCRMCGKPYWTYSEPPCRVVFLNKFHADLCYVCGARLVQFIKSYRYKDKWKVYTT